MKKDYKHNNIFDTEEKKRMKKQILLCTGFLVMNLCACGTGAVTEEVTEEVTATGQPTVTATPEPTEEATNVVVMEDERLSVKKGGDAFFYEGKEVPLVTKESDAYIMEVEYINDTQIAVYCHLSLNAEVFLVYDTEKEEYILEKKGLNFTWKDKDISTLVYVTYDGKESDLYNCNDEVLYHSEHSMGILSYTEDGKVEIEENLNDLDECDADWRKKKFR